MIVVFIDPSVASMGAAVYTVGGKPGSVLLIDVRTIRTPADLGDQRLQARVGALRRLRRWVMDRRGAGRVVVAIETVYMPRTTGQAAGGGGACLAIARVIGDARAVFWDCEVYDEIAPSTWKSGCDLVTSPREASIAAYRSHAQTLLRRHHDDPPKRISTDAAAAVCGGWYVADRLSRGLPVEKTAAERDETKRRRGKERRRAKRDAAATD